MRKKRILFVSLHRFGDIVMHSRVAENYLEANPDATIDILVNSQFVNVARLMGCYGQVHGFDRKTLQAMLKFGGVGIDSLLNAVRSRLEPLKGERYDTVVNLTHNRLSGSIVDIVGSEEVLGLSFTPQGKVVLNSPWTEHVNEIVSVSNANRMHFIDIFTRMTGGAPQGGAYRNIVSDTDVDSIVAPGEDYVVFQTQTSEKKKNWGDEKFASLARKLLDEGVGKIVLLSSPGEAPMNSEIAQMIGQGAVLAVTDLYEAASLLKKARYLVTGDTGIMHLAKAVGCRVLLVSVGSSDYHKCGPYGEGDVIVQSRVSCAPCSHGDGCDHDYMCGSSLEVEDIFAASGWLEGGRTVRDNTRARYYRTGFGPDGMLYIPLEPREVEWGELVGMIWNSIWTHQNSGSWQSVPVRMIADQIAERLEHNYSTREKGLESKLEDLAESSGRIETSSEALGRSARKILSRSTAERHMGHPPYEKLRSSLNGIFNMAREELQPEITRFKNSLAPFKNNVAGVDSLFPELKTIACGSKRLQAAMESFRGVVAELRGAL